MAVGPEPLGFAGELNEMDVNSLAEEQVATYGGGFSMLVLRDGHVERRILAGEARPGVPMNPDAILLWLSSGKPVTAAAIALLYERGEIALEQAVTDFIPAFAANGKHSITIRHLLTHTAGLHRVIPSVWESSDWDFTIARICEAALPPGFVPGSDAAYDPSAAWFMLAEIISRVAGESFESFVRREIFNPAGMHHAAFSFTDEQANQLSEQLASYYTNRAGTLHELHWNSPPLTRTPRPGASLRATIDEMARFYQALLEGRILSPDTLALFASSARGMKFDKTFGAQMDWGLGFMVKGDPRLAYSFAPSASEKCFGHGGQQTSIAWADPQAHQVVAAAFTTLPGERQHNQRMAALLASLENT